SHVCIHSSHLHYKRTYISSFFREKAKSNVLGSVDEWKVKLFKHKLALEREASDSRDTGSCNQRRRSKNQYSMFRQRIWRLPEVLSGRGARSLSFLTAPPPFPSPLVVSEPWPAELPPRAAAEPPVASPCRVPSYERSPYLSLTGFYASP
uniref:Uncharacterized protein n=1 Tax=Aegilops tauschii subsp. strangulata TaxID=200361 RepID=A0A452XIG1_AEGTS